jgi:phosphonate transport system substrate-binding protein
MRLARTLRDTADFMARFALSSDAPVPPFEKGGLGGICRPLRWLDPWLNPPQPPFAKGGAPTGATATRSSALNTKRAFAKGGVPPPMPDAISARSYTGVAFLLAALLLAACGREVPATAPRFSERQALDSPRKVYLLGVHPLHNPQMLFDHFQPLVDNLNRQLVDAEIRLEASRDYPSYDARLFARHFHLAMPNPYEAVEAERHGYRYFARWNNDADFRGLCLVRRDGGINSVADLKGRAVAYPAPSALAATMLPQWYLKQHGLDVGKDVVTHYVGSHESAILNVLNGSTALGCTWPPPWRMFQKDRPADARQLVPLFQTETLPSVAVMARADVPHELVEKLRDLLIHLNESEEGRRIVASIGIPGFAPADHATYQPVGEFIERFSEQIRAPQAEK